jgi:ribonuclease HI
VNTQSNIGYGAYLAVSERGLSLDSLRTRVKVRQFEHTSSTKLELQTLLWALGDIQALGSKVIVYTDCQNIMGLQGRRDRFEQNDYRSKKNKRLKNYKLYQEFYRMIDQLDCELVKVRGHQVSNQKDDIDRLFTLVDSASRNALRGDNRWPVVFNKPMDITRNSPRQKRRWFEALGDVKIYNLLQKEIKMKIYVGNLSYEVTEEDLRLALEQFGQVESATIIKDKHSGQSKGFGFVEMASKAEGQSAIDGLNGKELKGRALNVNEARPRTESRGSGGGYGGGRGGQGGGRGGRGRGRWGPKGGRSF